MASGAAVMSIMVCGNVSALYGHTERPRTSSPQLHQKQSVSC